MAQTKQLTIEASKGDSLLMLSELSAETLRILAEQTKKHGPDKINKKIKELAPMMLLWR